MNIFCFFLLFQDQMSYDSIEACEFVSKMLGLRLGGSGHQFVGSYPTKGCHAYDSGDFEDMVFYGTNGSVDQMKEQLLAPMYRPIAYNSVTNGLFDISFISKLIFGTTYLRYLFYQILSNFLFDLFHSTTATTQLTRLSTLELNPGAETRTAITPRNTLTSTTTSTTTTTNIKTTTTKTSKSGIKLRDNHWKLYQL